MTDKFFQLFGTRIPIPRDEESEAGPSHVQERDRAPHDLSVTTHDYDDYMDITDSDDDHSSTNDSESDVLSPKPLRVERVRRRRRHPHAPLQPQNDLSPELLEMISPAQPFFLYRKQLQFTDVDRSHNRLLVTETGRLREFLTEEEKAKSRVNVIAFDEHEREYSMTLSKWGQNDNISVVFGTHWNLMLRTNGVLVDDYVDFWGFRRDREGSTNEFCVAVAFSWG